MSAQGSRPQANPCPWCGDLCSGIKRVGAYRIRQDEVECMANALGKPNFTVPVLKWNEGYSTHSDTEDLVRAWCKKFGPCKCITIGLFGDDVCCNATAPRNGGCQCKPVKRKRVVDKQPAQPAPKLFQNSKFDPIPDQ